MRLTSAEEISPQAEAEKLSAVEAVITELCKTKSAFVCEKKLS